LPTHGLQRGKLSAVEGGKDPAGERKLAALDAQRKALTLADLIDQWDKLHPSAKRANYSTAATSSRGRSFALYGWAIRRGTLLVNPFQRVPVSPTIRRERVLSDDEIRRVWLATEGPGAINGIVRRLMLTGQRREEVAAMIWYEIAPDLSAWTVPASRAKNSVAHLVPLSPLAQTILRVASRFAKKSHEQALDDKLDLVFPGEQAPGDRPRPQTSCPPNSGTTNPSTGDLAKRSLSA
jgi:integrase